MERGIVSSDIYKILAAPSYKYDITMFDADGTGTISPIKAKWFYVKPINFMIQVPNGDDSYIRPEVYLWKSQDIKDEQTKEILSRIKNCANQYGYGFTINDFGSGNLPKKFSHIAMRDVEEKKLTESLSGSSMRSYYILPKAKTIIVHKSRIQEDDKSARTKNIKEIFIECNGERRRLPTQNINAAKAITMHLNEDGKLGDRFSTHVNNSAQDLDNLMNLLPHLEVNSKNVQSNKAKYFIDLLQNELKRSCTNKGYADLVSSLSSVPRIGKKYIQEFNSRLNSDGEHSDLMYSLARQYLMMECRNLGTYAEVIFENLAGSYPDLSNKDFVKMAKRVCLGCVDVDSSENAQSTMDIPYQDTDNKILLFGDRMVKILHDPYIREVVENLCSKPYLEEKDAKFITAVGNSIVGKYKPKFVYGNTQYGSDVQHGVDSSDSAVSEDSPEPDVSEEISNLLEWMKTNKL